MRGVPLGQQPALHLRQVRPADPAPALGIAPDAILRLVVVEVGQLDGTDDRHDAVDGTLGCWLGDENRRVIGALGAVLEWRQRQPLEVLRVSLGPLAPPLVSDDDHQLLDDLSGAELVCQQTGETINLHLTIPIVLLVQRRLIPGEDFHPAAWAVLGGASARVGADLILDDAGRTREVVHGPIGVGRLHEVMPYWASAGRPRQVDHRRVVRIAHPHAGHQVGGVTDRPGIAEVVGSAGFGGRRPGEFQDAGTVEGAAAGLAVCEDAGDEIGVLGRDDLLAGGRRIVHQDIAPAILDAQDRAGFHTHTATREDGESAGHLQQFGFTAAQRERQPIGGRPVIWVLRAVEFGRNKRFDAQSRAHLQHAVNSHELERLHGRDIVRVGERVAQKHRTVVLLVVIDRDVGRIGSVGELGAQVPHQRGRRPTALEGGDVGEGLDGGTRLAAAQRDVYLAVYIFVVEVSGADQRQDVASGWIKRDERAVGPVAVGQRSHALAHGLLGQRLQAMVERGVDAQALTPLVPVERLRAIHGLQRLPHVDDEVRSGDEVELGGFELIIAHLGGRQRSIGMADLIRPGLDHQRQHVLLASEGQVEAAAEGIVGGRQLRQASEEGCLRQREVGRIYAEVGVRSGLDTVGQVAVVNLVEVDLQDSLLGVGARQFSGQDGLSDLATDSLLHPLLGREQDIAG